MANKIVVEAHTVHGLNPLHLVEKIIRTRIHECLYWKEHCFALTAESLIEKAVELQYVGGVYGGSIKPTPFLCLLLKMLQLQPDPDIVLEYIRDEDFKYLRALGALYWRLTSSPTDVYTTLEPLYKDYRKLKVLDRNGQYQLSYMDEYIDQLLHEDRCCDVILPRVTARYALEMNNELEERTSELVDELEDEEEQEQEEEQDGEENEEEKDDGGASKEEQDSESRRAARSRSRSPSPRRSASPPRRRSDSRSPSYRRRFRSPRRGRRSPSPRSYRRRSRSRSPVRRRDRSPDRRRGRSRSRSPAYRRRGRSRSRSRSPAYRRHSPDDRRRGGSPDDRPAHRSRGRREEDREEDREARADVSRERDDDNVVVVENDAMAEMRAISSTETMTRGTRKSNKLKFKKGKSQPAAPPSSRVAGTLTNKPKTEEEEIAEFNALRAKLGLKPLE